MYRSHDIPAEPIQSLRVALALAERFDALLKGPTKVVSRKRSMDLIGVSANETGLSLRIGEAQQLYPEIWRHLDDARNGFAANGIDVSGYDAVRSEEGIALGADVSVKHREYGVGRYAVQEQVKEAGFNVAGLARAKRACDALVQATPMVDWEAIARAEDNDPAAAAFGRARRVKLAIMLVCGLAVIAVPFAIIKYMAYRDHARYLAYSSAPTVPTLNDAERATLAHEVTELRRQLTAALAAWPTATSPDRLAAIHPGSAPCAAPYRAPSEDAATAFIRTGTSTPALLASDFWAYLADGANAVPDGDLVRIDHTVARVERLLATGEVTPADRDRIAAIPRTLPFVLIDSDHEPDVTQTSPIAYTSGELIARGYVFSLAETKITCAATLAATSAPASPMPGFLEGARRRDDIAKRLHRDLEIALRRELAAKLRAI